MQKNAGSPSVSSSLSGVEALAGELRAQRIREKMDRILCAGAHLRTRVPA